MQFYEDSLAVMLQQLCESKEFLESVLNEMKTISPFYSALIKDYGYF